MREGFFNVGGASPSPTEGRRALKRASPLCKAYFKSPFPENGTGLKYSLCILPSGILSVLLREIYAHPLLDLFFRLLQCAGVGEVALGGVLYDVVHGGVVLIHELGLIYQPVQLLGLTFRDERRRIIGQILMYAVDLEGPIAVDGDRLTDRAYPLSYTSPRPLITVFHPMLYHRSNHPRPADSV